MSYLLVEALKVEAIFDAWVADLIEHYGDRPVKEVLGSAAIQSMFIGDMGQFCSPEEGVKHG